VDFPGPCHALDEAPHSRATRTNLHTIVVICLARIIHDLASRLWKASVRSGHPQGGAPEATLQVVEE